MASPLDYDHYTDQANLLLRLRELERRVELLERFVAQRATEDAPGIVELATEAEALAGTDEERAITPATLAVVIAAL